MSAVAAATRTYPVMEVFGPTIQGEGALAGLPTYFVRFGGCDYRCSWCDSMHAVEPAIVRRDAKKLEAREIIDRIRGLRAGADWVTLSGGNPALLDLGDLVDGIRTDPVLGLSVAVETQGSRWLDWLDRVDCLTVSPKPPSSGMADKTERDLPSFMAQAAAARGSAQRDDDALKIVVFDDADLDWATGVFRAYPEWPRYVSCGTDRPAVGETHTETLARLVDRYRWLCEAAAGNHVLATARILPQLHVLAWAHAKGV